MACHAGLAVREIVDRYGEVFEGINCLVDVGGCDGTTLRSIVEACPWIRGINFCLPQVISAAPRGKCMEHLSGDMFEKVPKAAAAAFITVYNFELIFKIIIFIL